MTILNEQTMRDMAQLMLDRATDSLQSVLQLISNPLQRAQIIEMLGILCLGLEAANIMAAFEADTGEVVSYEEAVKTVAKILAERAIELGEECSQVVEARMQPMTSN